MSAETEAGEGGLTSAFPGQAAGRPEQIRRIGEGPDGNCGGGEEWERLGSRSKTPQPVLRLTPPWHDAFHCIGTTRIVRGESPRPAVFHLTPLNTRRPVTSTPQPRAACHRVRDRRALLEYLARSKEKLHCPARYLVLGKSVVGRPKYLVYRHRLFTMLGFLGKNERHRASLRSDRGFSMDAA